MRNFAIANKIIKYLIITQMVKNQNVQYRVRAWLFNWVVERVHALDKESLVLCELGERNDALEISYILNGWGFPKFTIPENASDRSLALKAQRIIDRHPFDRSNHYYKKNLEIFAKANVERFKHVVSLIANPCIRRDLKQLWLLNHDCYTGKIDKDVFDNDSVKLIRSIQSAL